MPTIAQSAALMDKIKANLSDILDFNEISPAVALKQRGEMFGLHMKGKECSGPCFQIVQADEVMRLTVTRPETIPEEYFKVFEEEVHPETGEKAIKLTKLGFLDAEGNITEIKGWACIFHTPAEKQAPAYTYRSYTWMMRSCEQVYGVLNHLARAVVLPRWAI